MTKEEVITYIKEWLKDECIDCKDREALTLAVEALEQEPCDDVISRQAVLNILDDMVKDYIKENDFDKAQGVAWVKVQKVRKYETCKSTSNKVNKYNSLG